MFCDAAVDIDGAANDDSFRFAPSPGEAVANDPVCPAVTSILRSKGWKCLFCISEFFGITESEVLVHEEAIWICSSTSLSRTVPTGNLEVVFDT